MELDAVRAFFDRLAPRWDEWQDLTPPIAGEILTAAGIRPGTTVLDVGCGTGVLFPYYLERNVRKVVAVDLSPQMIRLAAEKKPDPRIELVCGDIQTLPVRCRCDAAVLFNCYPHFADPEGLFEALAKWLCPGGRLTVAHNLSLERLNAHHAQEADSVSRCAVTAQGIRELLQTRFRVDLLLERDDIFCISGTLLPEAEPRK